VQHHRMHHHLYKFWMGRGFPSRICTLFVKNFYTLN